MSLLSGAVSVLVADDPLITDWLSVWLSSIAIVIGVVVAGYVAWQSTTFHRENRAAEAEAYARDRYDAVVEIGVSILDAARQIQYSTSSRWAHLVGLDTVPDSPGDDEGRLAGGVHLASLETNAELLILSDKLLPQPPPGVDIEALRDALSSLRTEAAWLVGDANSALISFYGGRGYNPDLSGTRKQVIEELAESSIQNISQRLLFGHADHVPYWGQEGSPWPDAYRARVEALVAADPDGASDRILTASTAAAANQMLTTGVERFSTALFTLIDEHDKTRRHMPRRARSRS